MSAERGAPSPEALEALERGVARAMPAPSELLDAVERGVHAAMPSTDDVLAVLVPALPWNVLPPGSHVHVGAAAAGAVAFRVGTDTGPATTVLLETGTRWTLDGAERLVVGPCKPGCVTT